jgi:hypothetical protein
MLLSLASFDVEGPTFGDGPSVCSFPLVATTWHEIVPVAVPAVVGLYTCLRFAEGEPPSSNDEASIVNVYCEV